MYCYIYAFLLLFFRLSKHIDEGSKGHANGPYLPAYLTVGQKVSDTLILPFDVIFFCVIKFEDQCVFFQLESFMRWGLAHKYV
jgi:hypothetical protein